MSRFSGLMSRWITFYLWQNSIALSNWYIYFRTASGGRPYGLSSKISRRFFSKYSKTRYSRFFLNAWILWTYLLKTSSNLTMLSASFSYLSIATSLFVVFLTTSSSSLSLNFLIATTIENLGIANVTQVPCLFLLGFVNNAVGSLAYDAHYLIFVHLVSHLFSYCDLRYLYFIKLPFLVCL